MKTKATKKAKKPTKPEACAISEQTLASLRGMVAQTHEGSELATTLAALRLFQETYENQDASEIREDWPDHFNGIEPLGTQDIDTLCERLNRTTNSADDKLGEIEDIIANHHSEEDEPFTKAQLKQILDSIVEVMDKKAPASSLANSDLKPSSDPVIFIEGGLVRDVISLVPSTDKPYTDVPYWVVDYDIFDTADDEEIAEYWQARAELHPYFKMNLPDEFQRFEDAIKRHQENQKMKATTKPKAKK